MTDPLKGLTIGFLGAGTMGQALIRGLACAGVPRRRLVAADPNRRAQAAARRLGAMTVSAAHLAREADVLVLAVKPQHMADVLADVAPSLRRDQRVISIAAGLTLRWLEARLPGVSIVRAMPNLPATVGCGFAAIARGRRAGAMDAAIARAIFAAAGVVCELPERHFDAITAVSGSGPAYVFWLVDAWEQAAARLGLPAGVAAAAIRQTLSGSSRLLAEDVPAAEWIRRVASKGGTTEAALRVFTRRRLTASMAEALHAAARRSRQLTKGA